MTANAPWTHAEDALLAQYLAEFPYPSEKVSALTGRTVRAIDRRTGQLREYLRTGAALPNTTAAINGGAFHARSIPGSAKFDMKCLGCQKSFKSWDRTKNRLCQNCSGRSDDTTHTRHTFKKGA